MGSSRPHPSSLPNLALVYLISTDAIPVGLIDSVVELALGLVYEARPAGSLEQWLNQLAAVQPRIQSVALAREVQESVSPRCERVGGWELVHSSGGGGES